MPLELKTEVPGAGPQLVLFPAFALSGAAALISQVCWQRILFTSFGVDIESTPLIVSTCMLGLGCGALIGGVLADRWRGQRIELFALAKLGIGLFGLASPPLLRAGRNAHGHHPHDPQSS